MLLFLYLFLAATVIGCEATEADSFRLSNHTKQTTSLLAMTAEQSYLFDLSPKGTVGSHSIILSPGESETVFNENILGYKPDSDLHLYFYEVIGDSTFYSGSLVVSGSQLRRWRYHILIDDEELTKSKIR